MRAQSLAAGVGIGLGTLIIAGGLFAEFAGGRPAARHQADALQGEVVPPAPTTTTSLPAGWRAVVPATTVPEATPVQEQYDRGFEVGFSSASNKAMMRRAESLPMTPPAIEGGWPALQWSDVPERWTTEFVGGLLDIDFAHQSRRALGAWLTAAEAPDLLPGIPTAFEDLPLYVSLMEPAITGEGSPIPSPGEWEGDAAAGLKWAVSDVEVQLDPHWQKMIDAGWQPADIRSAVEDVSGVLTAGEGKRRTASRFSMVVQVGSARFDDGYGSVLVSDWRKL